ncbi:MAG TPA: hypothetical protein VHZ32_01630, partial [Rhizomicrobium sp.]|nr:hypothetical protein [Rhizomicrobium sp.]
MQTAHAIAIATLMLAAPLPAVAQSMGQMPVNQAACTAPAALPPALSGWTVKADLASATDAAGLDKAALAPGKAANVGLHHTREITFVTQPEKPGGSVAYGGMLSLAIAQAGTYQVSLGAGPWIDVLKDGAAVTSGVHGPGPACSGIRKTVQFPLQPGRYVIQIS